MASLSFFALWRGQVPQRGSYLTKEGLSKLEAELEHLRTVRRQEVASRIQKANEIGGTVDNAEYDDAKNEQAFVEGRILTLEKIAESAVIIGDNVAHSDSIQLGSHVVVLDSKGKEAEYTIVGSAEADPLQGRISNESPVGKALLNKKVGEDVQVNTPAGAATFTISSIS
ncbi:MAG: transcription elongation factor GreA [Chloroflexi bacterium]|nr:transcription elongation factor GreA [Chloroflexota bacterium]